MKLGLAQVNPTVGDLAGNVERILRAAREAAAQGAQLVVFPEMALPGYPPRDILYDESFVEATQAAARDLAGRARGLPPLLVGSCQPSGQRLYQHPALHNVALWAQEGGLRVAAVKRLLPGYDVFYEPRWFVPGERCLPPLEVEGTQVGVLICEDLWDEGYPVHPSNDLKRMGADLLVCMAASPFRLGGEEERGYHARRTGLPLGFVNLVGGNDELIFDGGSFWMGRGGATQVGRFEERVRVVDTETGAPDPEIAQQAEATLFQALRLGVRDFAHKNGVRQAALGLSGGVDSSVAAVIAVEALGAENVTGVAIPSRYTDPRSTACARALAEGLGMGFEVVEMEALHRCAEETLGDLLEGTAAENAQARIRMMILMAFVNKRGGLLLNTSNKTELAVGYGTLYGDLAGTLSPLGDVSKPQVYGLARWINREREVIPAFALERPPSAELRPGQVDPFDYEALAAQVERLLAANQSDAAMRAAEHKRRQFGVALKVSAKAFGSGRMVPVGRR